MDSYVGSKGELLTHNVFAYSLNNPVNMVDPNGTFAFAIPFVGQAIIGALSTVAAVLSAPVVAVSALVIALGLLIYSGYKYSKANDNANSQGNGSETKTNEFTQPSSTTKDTGKSRTFPQNPADMDEVLNVSGKKVKDGPTTQGRDKTKWKLPDDITVTHEQHPYDTNAPEFHKGPHYHVDGPGFNHNRFMPGAQLPNIFNP